MGTSYTVVEGIVETSGRSFTYNHLGQMTQLVDNAGTRTFGYNTYGERESDSLAVDGDTHLISETRDVFGRSTGFAYSKNGTVQHTVTTGYGTDGRISSAGFTHGGAVKQFGYEYLNGSNLLHKLTKPNNMVLTQTYEATRDLLTGMAYHRGSTLVAQRTYSYDLLGRPTARNTARQGSVVNDTFAHNTRSELVEATVSGKDYEYAYDNIGNREFSLEDGKATMYEANELNQYTAISENGAAPFVPQFDADGNQTLIKTDTGIWSAVYNAENRPVSFTNSESNTVVECAYDSMGRRAYKKVTVNGNVTLHQRYIYRGYLQIACVDLTRSNHPALWFITWDPTQLIATRPLAIQKDGTWFTYGIDLTKNVCEVFGATGYIGATYSYTPYGKVASTGNVQQPIQWSSEFMDGELSLLYYNYRHYNPLAATWLGRDRIESNNMFNPLFNNPIYYFDNLGLTPDKATVNTVAYVNPYAPKQEKAYTLNPERMKGNHPPVDITSHKSTGKITASIDGTGCASITHVRIEKNMYHLGNLYYSRKYTSKYTSMYPYNNFKEEAKSEHTLDMRDLFSPNGVLSLALGFNEKSHDLTSSNICYTFNRITDNKESKILSLGFNVLYGESNKYSLLVSYKSPSGTELTGTVEAHEGKPLHGIIKATVPFQDPYIDNLNYSINAEVHSRDYDYGQSKFDFKATYKLNKHWSVYGSIIYNHHIENTEPFGIGGGFTHDF